VKIEVVFRHDAECADGGQRTAIVTVEFVNPITVKDRSLSSVRGKSRSRIFIRPPLGFGLGVDHASSGESVGYELTALRSPRA
jgi:hypothetical protein